MLKDNKIWDELWTEFEERDEIYQDIEVAWNEIQREERSEKVTVHFPQNYGSETDNWLILLNHTRNNKGVFILDFEQKKTIDFIVTIWKYWDNIFCSKSKFISKTEKESKKQNAEVQGGVVWYID